MKVLCEGVVCCSASKTNPLILRELPQPCGERQCWSPKGWQDQSSAGAAHCQAALGLSSLQHVGWAWKGWVFLGRRD